MRSPRSPYRTAPGSEPPELAGRDAQLGAARYAIDMASAYEPANPIVFLGLRGMGKTALLRDVAATAERAGGLALIAQADRELRFADVMRDQLTRTLAASQTLPIRLRNAVRLIIDHLPKLSYDLPHEAGSVSIESAGESPGEGGDDLETQILDLSEHLKRDDRFLMIGLDEIQEANRRDLLRIVRVVHRTAGSRAPILFVGAGLPSTPSILHEVRTYTERWAKFSLDLLDADATYAAVERPAKMLGVRWERGALERMYAISFGYPFFVQQYASAVWLQSAGATITKNDVDAVVPGVRLMLDASLYEPQFAQLTRREVNFVLALDALGPGSHRVDEVSRKLGLVSSAEIGSTRARLEKKDVIFSAIRGRVEFRMPLANDYIERHRADIEKLAR